MEPCNEQNAKTRFSELLQLAERGNDVVIARAGRPVAKLVRIDRPAKRELGFLGPLDVPNEAFEPMSRRELSSWETPVI